MNLYIDGEGEDEGFDPLGDDFDLPSSEEDETPVDDSEPEEPSEDDEPAEDEDTDNTDEDKSEDEKPKAEKEKKDAKPVYTKDDVSYTQEELDEVVAKGRSAGQVEQIAASVKRDSEATVKQVDELTETNQRLEGLLNKFTDGLIAGIPQIDSPEFASLSEEQKSEVHQRMNLHASVKKEIADNLAKGESKPVNFNDAKDRIIDKVRMISIDNPTLRPIAASEKKIQKAYNGVHKMLNEEYGWGEEELRSILYNNPDVRALAPFLELYMRREKESAGKKDSTSKAGRKRPPTNSKSSQKRLKIGDKVKEPKDADELLKRQEKYDKALEKGTITEAQWGVLVNGGTYNG